MRFKNKLMIMFMGLIILSLVGWIFFLNTSTQDNEKTPPNILLISLDACRADHLSCYGYHRPTSPFLDELASRGTRFENAFVNSLGTASSHTTMFTSLYDQTFCKDFWKVPIEKAVSENLFFAVPENIIMLQEIMKQNGYYTIAVTGGKIFKTMKYDRGFDEFEYTSEVFGIESGVEKLLSLVKKYSKKGKPIFAFFHTYEIHAPYLPPDEYREIFGTYKSDFETTGMKLLVYSNKASTIPKSDLDYITMMYDAGIKYADDMLRRMFSGLEKIGFFDNYLIIITADHGEEFGEHGGLLHRNILFDEILHVPMIVTGSTVPKGRIDRRLVNTIDIMPTILASAGIKTNTPVEGKPLFFGNMNPDMKNEMVFVQNRNIQYCVRTHEWKFIEDLNASKFELYNLHNDPRELNNISKNHPELCKKLKNTIEHWRANLIEIPDLKTGEINYTPDDIKRLRSLGYVTR